MARRLARRLSLDAALGRAGLTARPSTSLFAVGGYHAPHRRKATRFGAARALGGRRRAQQRCRWWFRDGLPRAARRLLLRLPRRRRGCRGRPGGGRPARRRAQVRLAAGAARPPRHRAVQVAGEHAGASDALETHGAAAAFVAPRRAHEPPEPRRARPLEAVLLLGAFDALQLRIRLLLAPAVYQGVRAREEAVQPVLVLDLAPRALFVEGTLTENLALVLHLRLLHGLGNGGGLAPHHRKARLDPRPDLVDIVVVEVQREDGHGGELDEQAHDVHAEGLVRHVLRRVIDAVEDDALTARVLPLGEHALHVRDALPIPIVRDLRQHARVRRPLSGARSAGRTGMGSSCDWLWVGTASRETAR